MHYSKQQREELYNRFNHLKEETEIPVHDLNLSTGNIEGPYIPPERFIELYKLAKELWVNCQIFLDTLQPNEKFDIQNEAEKDLSH